MGQLKAFEVDGFIARPNRSAPVILLYGPDDGLVSEHGDSLAKNSGVDLKDPFSLIRLSADDVGADPSRLADEAHTISMFGGDRFIRISGSTRKDLLKAVSQVLTTAPQDCWIVIEAGDLKKSSGLRKQVEKSPNGLALPCYQDNDSALNMLIQNEIIDAGFQIDQETRNFLRSQLGADRRASRNELKKLALYAYGKSEILLDDVRAVVGDMSAFLIDDIIDATATGNLNRLEMSLARGVDANTPSDMLTVSALRHFQLLHEARWKMETRRENSQNAFKSFRPPVHFSRRDAVITALNGWNCEKLQRSLLKLEKAALDCRRYADLAPTIASTALLAIALEARKLMR